MLRKRNISRNRVLELRISLSDKLRTMKLFAKRRISLRQIALIVWLMLWPLLLALHFYPIRDATTRAALVSGVFLLWSGALAIFWKKKTARFGCLALLVFALGIAVLPARRDDAQALRREYVRSLNSYRGTPYVWGGETRRGIDCSGLMRCALIDANLHRGITTLNPALLRHAFSLWWHDCSALAMQQEYRGQTRLLFRARALNDLDESQIEAGDIAVTASGAHVLAFTGNRTWIEADPNLLNGNAVVQVKLPSRIAWFHTPMTILRWRQLEG